jgi:hypothetical protein
MFFEECLAFGVVKAHRLLEKNSEQVYAGIVKTVEPFLARSEKATDLTTCHPLGAAFCIQSHGALERTMLWTTRIDGKKCCFLVCNATKRVYLISLSLASVVFDDSCLFECILLTDTSPPTLKITDTIIYKNVLLDSIPLLCRMWFAWITIRCHHTPQPKLDPVALTAEIYTPTLLTLGTEVARSTFLRAQSQTHSVISVVIRPMFVSFAEEEEQKLRSRYFV